METIQFTKKIIENTAWATNMFYPNTTKEFAHLATSEYHLSRGKVSSYCSNMQNPMPNKQKFVITSLSITKPALEKINGKFKTRKTDYG